MKNIPTWRERLFEARPDLIGQWPDDSGALDEIGCWIKDDEIYDLRAYIAELEARPAAPVVAEGLDINAERNLYDAWANSKNFEPTGWQGWLAAKRRAAHPVAGSPAEAVKWEICGVCLGRGERDIAHGKVATCPACMGKGSVRTPAAAAPMPASEAASAEVILQARSPEGDPWTEVSTEDFVKANANGYETSIHIARPGQNSVRLQVAAPAAPTDANESKRLNAYASLVKAQAGRISHLNAELAKRAETVNTLASERQANAILTAENCELRLCCRNDAHAVGCTTYDPARKRDEFDTPTAPPSVRDAHPGDSQ